MQRLTVGALVLSLAVVTWLPLCAADPESGASPGDWVSPYGGSAENSPSPEVIASFDFGGPSIITALGAVSATAGVNVIDNGVVLGQELTGSSCSIGYSCPSCTSGCGIICTESVSTCGSCFLSGVRVGDRLTVRDQSVTVTAVLDDTRLAVSPALRSGFTDQPYFVHPDRGELAVQHDGILWGLVGAAAGGGAWLPSRGPGTEHWGAAVGVAQEMYWPPPTDNGDDKYLFIWPPSHGSTAPPSPDQ